MQTKIVFSFDAAEAYKNLSLKANNSERYRMLIAAIKDKLARLSRDCPLSREDRQNYPSGRHKHENRMMLIRLPLYWRMLYTVHKDRIEIRAFKLNIRNQREYQHKAMKRS